MRIIKYINNKRVEIEFLETGERKWVRYDQFSSGSVTADLIKYPYPGYIGWKKAVILGLTTIGIMAATASLIIYAVVK